MKIIFSFLSNSSTHSIHTQTCSYSMRRDFKNLTHSYNYIYLFILIIDHRLYKRRIPSENQAQTHTQQGYIYNLQHATRTFPIGHFQIITKFEDFIKNIFIFLLLVGLDVAATLRFIYVLVVWANGGGFLVAHQHWSWSVGCRLGLIFTLIAITSLLWYLSTLLYLVASTWLRHVFALLHRVAGCLLRCVSTFLALIPVIYLLQHLFIQAICLVVSFQPTQYDKL